MKIWHVNITDSAERDIDEIYNHIAEKLIEPATAWNQIERIYNGIFTLDKMPQRCPLLQEEPWQSKGLRKLTVDNYFVIFEIQESIDIVNIIAVLYSRRDLAAIEFNV